MRNLLIASVFAIAWANVGPTQAQVYPSRPITMIVPLPAGSAFDVTARLVAERMRVLLGQPVIVENPTGASGSVGTGRCARAVPDGYTLCFGGGGTHVLNGRLGSPVRCAEGFRAGLAHRDRPVADRRQESHGGERP